MNRFCFLIHARDHAGTCGLMSGILAAAMPATASVDWENYREDFLFNSNPTLVYVRASTDLCIEVESGVWSTREMADAATGLRTLWLDVSEDANRAALDFLGVYVVPTALVWSEGREVARLQRSGNTDEYRQLLERVKNPRDTSGHGLSASGSDPEGDVSPSELDLETFSVEKRDEGIFIRLVTAAVPARNRPTAYNVLIDADGNPVTGFEDNHFEGADFLLQGASLHAFAGSDNLDWKWKLVEEVDLSVVSHGIDILIPGGLPGTSLADNTGLQAFTQDQEWNAVDRIPSRGTLRLRKQDQHQDGEKGQASRDLNNRTLSDSPIVLTDTVGDSTRGLDLRSGSLWVRDDHFVAAVVLDAEPLFNAVHFYMDTDNRASSGLGGVSFLGADYMVENGRLHRYIGEGGSDWRWEDSGAVDTKRVSQGIAYKVEANRVGLKQADRVRFWFAITNSNWDEVDYVPNDGPASFIFP